MARKFIGVWLRTNMVNFITVPQNLLRACFFKKSRVRFQKNKWPKLCESTRRALQHFQFSAFYIDLNEGSAEEFPFSTRVSIRRTSTSISPIDSASV